MALTNRARRVSQTQLKIKIEERERKRQQLMGTYWFGEVSTHLRHDVVQFDAIEFALPFYGSIKFASNHHNSHFSSAVDAD